jgi:hypothetical protein
MERCMTHRGAQERDVQAPILRKHLHDLRGSMSVVAGFVRRVERETLDADGQLLYDACTKSLQSMATDLDAMSAHLQCARASQTD